MITTADFASPIGGDNRHISLKKSRADVALTNGAYVAPAANGSILDREAGLMSLSGGVTPFHVSQGFRVRDDGDTIEFTGKAYMKIYPKQKNQEGQGG